MRYQRLARSELPVDTAALARFLIGKVVVRETPDGLVSGVIVETEAYVIGDAAGHAYRGMTPRNRSLFLAPRCVAFLGKAAYAAMRGRRTVDWGRQAEPFGGAIAWVLPNPSGRNLAFSQEALVAAYRELRLAIEGTMV